VVLVTVVVVVVVVVVAVVSSSSIEKFVSPTTFSVKVNVFYQ
jgi:hypothetical protein